MSHYLSNRATHQDNVHELIEASQRPRYLTIRVERDYIVNKGRASLRVRRVDQK